MKSATDLSIVVQTVFFEVFLTMGIGLTYIVNLFNTYVGEKKH